MPRRRNTENLKRKRSIDRFKMAKYRYYIFCEGEKTEKLYFESFKRHIELNALYKNMVQIRVEGCGKETLRVLEEAKKYVEEERITQGEIWCIYDKDDFPAEHFNAVPQRMRGLETKELRYHAAWSNQCFEYWILLHFGRYSSDNSRNDYIKNIDNKFASVGLKKYNKGDVYDLLLEYGNPGLAIRYASEQLTLHIGKTDAESVPATKVHLLVKELAQYLPEDVKDKFL